MFTVVCPNCSATYQLDEAKGAVPGRKMKCAKCQHIWAAMPLEKIEEKVVSPVVDAPVTSAEAPVSAAAAVPTEPAANAAPHFSIDTPLPEEMLTEFADVGRQPSALRMLKGDAKWLWGSMAFCVLGALASVWVLWGGGEEQSAVDHHVPENIEVSDGLSGKVAVPEGLQVSDVSNSFVKEGEQAVMVVEGRLQNKLSSPVKLPVLQVELLDTNDQVLDVLPVALEKDNLDALQGVKWRVEFKGAPLDEIQGYRAVFVAG